MSKSEDKLPRLDPQSKEARLAGKRRKRSGLFLFVAAVVVVIVPFLFWHGTWFGRDLSDKEVEEYLTDQENHRHNQHALVQIAQRIGRGDKKVNRWYPQVISQSQSPYPEVRVTAAWVMGADNQSDGFHQALLGMLSDPEPLVRRNGALSLVRFGDGRGKQELLNMLRPYVVRVTRGGIIHYRVNDGDAVDHGTILSQLEVENQELFDIKSPLPGRAQKKLVADGLPVVRNQEVMSLSPSTEHVWEALRALYLVGEAEDFAEVERFVTDPSPAITPEIREQAGLTAAEIRRRSATPASEKAPSIAPASSPSEAPVR